MQVRSGACPALSGRESTARSRGLKSDVEVDVQEQQRRVKHEKGEGEMENDDTCANTFYRHLSRACM